jgi:hypothetical protein
MTGGPHLSARASGGGATRAGVGPRCEASWADRGEAGQAELSGYGIGVEGVAADFRGYGLKRK